jgi:hypothetical protein
VVQIVTLTSTLTYTGEDGETTVSLGNVVLKFILVSFYSFKRCAISYNQLLNEHSLSDTGSSKETNLTTTSVWGEEIDDLDTSDEHFSGCGLFSELWWIGVDGAELVRLDGTTFINGVTSDVHDTTEGTWADGNHDRSSSVGSDGTSYETLGTVHGNTSHDILTKMLLIFG